MSIAGWTAGASRRTVSVFVLMACCALAGCATVATSSLSPDEVATLKLTGVTVSFAPDAEIMWEDGVRAYGAAKGISDDALSTTANTPEGKAFARNALAARIKTAFESKLVDPLNGKRPVRLELLVRRFTVASAVQRILVGGGHGMVADATLVDAKTGAIILTCPNLNAIALAGNGLLGTAIDAAVAGDPTERVLSAFHSRYRDWLMQRA